MAISTDLRKRVKAVAAELRREIYGPLGAPKWGTKFTKIEDTATELGDAIACELIGQSLDEQAGTVDDGSPVVCAVCGRGAKEDDLEPRIIQTRRGDAVWRERKYYCKHCRKAFFPSVERFGH